MRFINLIPLGMSLISGDTLVAGQPDSQSPTISQETESDCHNACLALVSTLGDSAFYNPASSLPGFREQFFSGNQRDAVPACIVTPSSVSQVAQALSIITQHSCIFAIKSGGHAPGAGASNANGGITIDLRKINDIEVSDTLETARIGTGNRWAKVYGLLEPLNRTIAGGRNSDVGVGGFVLGGGISFVSRRYGWAADNVRNYEVVLANGSLANINQASSPDLYYALRGGGNNFGIVTHFDMEIHPQGQIWGGESFLLLDPVYIKARKALLNIAPEPFSFSPSYLKNKLCNALTPIACKLGYCVTAGSFWQAVENVIMAEQKDKFSHFISTLTWSREVDAWVYNTALVYSKPVDKPAVFDDFLVLPTVSSTNKIRNFTTMYDEVAALSEYGMRHYWSTATFKPSAALLTSIEDIMIEEIEAVRYIKGNRPSIIVQPINLDEISLTQKNGGNPLGIATEDGPLVLFSIAFLWSNAADDEIMRKAGDSLLRRAVAKAKEMGLYHRYTYQNYADPSQDVFAGYGEVNRARLREIQKKYDPEGVFSRLQPGYFKV